MLGADTKPGVLSFVAAWRDVTHNRGHAHSMYRTINIVADDWKHIAVTINKLGGKFFINGTQWGAVSISGHFWRGMQVQGIPLRIGYCPHAWDVVGRMGIFFDGYIDEVRIWSKERSEEEIQSTMLNTLSPEYSLNEKNLVAYYRFVEFENLGVGDDGLYDDIRDLSAYGNHGDMIGFADLVDFDVTVSVASGYNEIPDEFVLMQNYPNPFNPETVISYSVPEPRAITLNIYDLHGKEIETLVNEFQLSGIHTIKFDAGNLPTGIYFYRLNAGNFVQTKKLIIQK